MSIKTSTRPVISGSCGRGIGFLKLELGLLLIKDQERDKSNDAILDSAKQGERKTWHGALGIVWPLGDFLVKNGSLNTQTEYSPSY